MATPNPINAFVDSASALDVANKRAFEEGLESAFQKIPKGMFTTDIKAINTIRNILKTARDTLGSQAFGMLTTWIVAYTVSKSGRPQLIAKFQPLIGAADEVVAALIDSGEFPSTDSTDSKASKPASKITGPIWCDGEVVHHTRHHPILGRVNSGGEEAADLMGGYVRGDKHFCTECFNPDQIAGFLKSGWSPTVAPALGKPPPPSENFSEWDDYTRELFAHLYNEALRESKEGDYDRGVERIAPVLLAALHVALTWDKSVAKEAFAGADPNWQTAIKDRGADVRQLFALPIAKVIALANADKAEIPGGTKSSGLADVIARLSAALNIPDEWRGTLDAAIRTLPEREQESFTALLAERAGSVAASVSRLMTQVALPGIFAIVIAWTFLPMFAWSEGNTQQIIFLMIGTVIAFYLQGVLGYFFTNEELVEASTEDSVPIAGGSDRRYQPGHVREAKARYGNGVNSAAAAAAYIVSFAYTLFGAPLLGAVTATIYGGLLAARGDFIWYPLFLVVMLGAIWYIPFLLIDMGVATVSGLTNTVLSLIPNEGIKARAAAALNSDAPFNTWKDVGLKAVNGLQMLGLLQLIIYWPIYPFARIPGAMAVLAGYLMVLSWYGSSLLTMARPQNGTDPSLLGFLAEKKRDYTRIALRLFASTIFIALSTTVLVGMNGGPNLQRADTLGYNGSDRPESIATVFGDFFWWMVTPSPAQVQAQAAAQTYADNCQVLKSAIQADPGFCGSPAGEASPLCARSTNPTCWPEIARSITAFHQQNK